MTAQCSEKKTERKSSFLLYVREVQLAAPLIDPLLFPLSDVAAGGILFRSHVREESPLRAFRVRSSETRFGKSRLCLFPLRIAAPRVFHEIASTQFRAA